MTIMVELGSGARGQGLVMIVCKGVAGVLVEYGVVVVVTWETDG